MKTIQINMGAIQQFKDRSHALQLFNRAESALFKNDDKIETCNIAVVEEDITISEYFIGIADDGNIVISSYGEKNEELEMLASQLKGKMST